MKSAYPKIFEPITIKRTTIKNRIAMTPMGTNYGETSGEMSNRHMNYYSLRAKRRRWSYYSGERQHRVPGRFQRNQPDPYRPRQLYAALLSVSRKPS